MHNLDILLLTAIVSTLFVVFIIAIWRELKSTDENSYKNQKDGGPRASLVNFIGNLTTNQRLTQSQKELVYMTIKRTISDMESDGLYFSNDVKEELEEKRKELYCEYSDLPSPKSYQD